MRNEFSSEKLGSRVPNCTRKEYSEILAVHFITEKRDKEKAMNKLNTSGNNPILIEKGKQDRLAGLSIEGNFYNIEGITGKYNLVSYHYGYTALASRTLAVSIPEKKYTDDSLRMIGYNDAQDENIVFEELPEAVRECAAYLEGYKLGLEKSKTKKAK